MENCRLQILRFTRRQWSDTIFGRKLLFYSIKSRFNCRPLSILVSSLAFSCGGSIYVRSITQQQQRWRLFRLLRTAISFRPKRFPLTSIFYPPNMWRNIFLGYFFIYLFFFSSEVLAFLPSSFYCCCCSVKFSSTKSTQNYEMKGSTSIHSFHARLQVAAFKSVFVC